MVSDAQLEALLRQLAASLKAGLGGPTMLPGLLSTLPAPLHGPLKRALLGGALLSTTLGDAQLVTAADRALIEAGERSGRLPELLVTLADTVRERRQTRTKALVALAYPALIVSLAGFLLTAPLAVTRGIGAWLSLAVWPSVIVALCFLLARVVLPALPPTSPARVLPRRLALSLPVVGGALERGAYATFCEVLSQLLAAGLPYTLSLPAALDASGHPRLEGAAARVLARLDDGGGLAECLRETGALPERLLLPIAAAERSGTVDVTLSAYGRDERAAYRQGLLALVAASGVMAFLVVATAVAVTLVAGAQSYVGDIEAVLPDE